MKTLEAIDDCLGLIRKQVGSSGLEKQTVFVIASDHGFWPVRKAFSPDGVLASFGLAAPDSKKSEWRVSAYASGGSFA